MPSFTLRPAWLQDSAWVAQRRRLEEAKPEGAAEVLLSTQDGLLLEGLITNLFIVAGEWER